MTSEPALKTVKYEIEFGFGKFFLLLLMFLTIFALPIKVVEYLNTEDQHGWGVPGTGGRIAGLATDNTGRYVQLPLLNFQFDTTLREPSTISFMFGTILILLALVIVIIFFIDFRKREHKYSS